jgi:hypothetical protein
MGDLSIAVVAAELGLLIGAGSTALGFSALRSFAGAYALALLIVTAVFLSSGSFVLALLGTMAVALFSFLPAAGGCVVGARFARLAIGKSGGADRDNPTPAETNDEPGASF